MAAQQLVDEPHYPLLVGPHYPNGWGRLNERLQAQAQETVATLCANPRSPGLNTEALFAAGGVGVYSARVTRQYRLIFARLDDDRPVLLWIDNHDEAYGWARQRRSAIATLVKRAEGMHLATGGLPPSVPRASEHDPLPVANPDVLAEMAKRGFPHYFAALDDRQVRLVTLDIRDRAEPVFVKAGAGTGKTVVAIRRAIHLAERPEMGYGPVLYLCFNQVLMQTVRRTIEALAPPGSRNRIEVSTFHHWSARYLDLHDINLEIDQNGGQLTAAVNRLRRQLPAGHRDNLANIATPDIAAEIRNVLRRNQFGTVEEYVNLERPRSQGLPPLRRPQREAIWELDRLTSPAADGPHQWDDQIELARSILANDRRQPVHQAVLVDEGQDCSPVMVRLAKALVAGEERRLMFFADPAQSIYPAGYIWARREIDPGGRQRRTLPVPYRSTRQIHALAASLYENNQELRREVGELRDTGRDGPLPTLAECADGGAELAFVADAIRAEITAGREPWQIGVLTSTNARRNEARAHLAAAGVPAHAVERAAPDGVSVSVVTVHSAKGLDFASVYLLDVEPKGDATDSERAQLYVALTRSSEALTVVCRPGTRSPLLGDLDPDRYRTHEGGAA